MDRNKEDISEPPREEDEGDRHISNAELLGQSEYSRRSAGGGGEREQEHSLGRTPGREELVADPEDLGRRALEDATQSLPLEAEQTEAGAAQLRRRRRARRGERRMREVVAESEANDDRLISRMDDRSEKEALVSREALWALQKLDKET